MPRNAVRLALLALGPALLSCSGGTETVRVDKFVVPVPSVVITGTGVNRNVEAIPHSARNVPLTVPVEWDTSDPDVVTVSGTTKDATLTSVGKGFATVTATAGGKSGTIQVEVKADVQSVSPNPSSAVMEELDTRTVSATVTADAGVDTRVTWTSSNLSVATVSPAHPNTANSGANVTVTAVSQGSSVLRAASVADPTKFAEVAITVTERAVASVEVSLVPTTVTPPQTSQATAVAKDKNGVVLSEKNVSLWSSSNPAVATVEQSTAKVSCLAAGTVTISATIENKIGQSPLLTCNAPANALLNLVVTPGSPVTLLGPGATQVLTTTPTTANAGVQVGYASTSSNPAVATVTQLGPNPTVTIVGNGTEAGARSATITITATGSGPDLSTNSIQRTVDITVPAVATVDVALGSNSISVAQTTQATATPKAANGTVLTGRVVSSWSAGNPAVASVNTTTGVVTGVSAGQTTISATIGGVSGNSPSLTVTPQVLPDAITNLVVTPGVFSLCGPTGAQMLTTTPTLSGGAQVTYANTSSNASIATVTPTNGANPTVTAVAVGGPVTITVNATGSGPGLNTNSIAQNVSVTIPAVASLQVTLGSSTIDVGATTQASYLPRDGTGTQLCNRPVTTWSSSNPSVATVSGSGLVTAVGSGTTNISALVEGVTGISGTLTVSTPAFADISAGGHHSCGRTNSGSVYCWGTNGAGQVGDGTFTGPRLLPTKVSGNLLFNQHSLGFWRSCGVATTNGLHCWGDNVDGEIGDGTTVNRNLPTFTIGGNNFVEVTGGGYHTCARTAANAAWCWGYNGQGELGDGTQTQRNQPVAVTGGLTFVQLTGGEYHTCGRTGAGVAYCWGYNTSGQLGDGTFVRKLVPTLVTGGHTFAALAAGRNHTCGITTGGATYCWGFNGDGQVGDGSNTNRPNPTLVLGGHTFTKITTDDHSCALNAAGAAYCWGVNSNGQIGDNSNFDRTQPVAVSGGFTFTHIDAGGLHTCARTNTGAAYCWGYNLSGQLGDGTQLTRLVPTKVK